MAETVGEMLVKIGADISDLKAKFANIESSMKGLHSTSKSVFGSIGETIKGAFVFTGVYEGINLLTESIKGAMSAGIEWNSNMQQNQIAFTQLMHSSQQAQQMLQQLTDFAKNTPFELPQVEDMAKKLLAFGFNAKEVIPMLTAVGDAAAGLGLGADGAERLTIALGQMAAKGKVQSDEMLQLVEAGVPAWDILAKAMGVSTAQLQKMVEKGVVPADKAIKALVAGMEQRFPHMMDAQSKSFAGMMSNIKDSFGQLMGTVMKPTFDWLNNTALPALQTGLGAFSQGFQTGGFIGGLDAMAEAFQKSGGAGVTFARVLDGVKGAILLVKGDAQGAAEIFSDLGVPDGVIDTFLGLRQTVANVMNAIKGLLRDVYAVAAPAFKATFENIVAFFRTNWPEIKQAVHNVMTAIRAIMSVVWPIIKAVVIDTVKAIMDGIKHGVDFILTVIKFFADLFTGHWSNLWADVKRLFSDALRVLWDWLQVWGVGKVLKWFGGWGKLLGEKVKGAWDGIKSIWSKVTGWLYDHTIGKFKQIVDRIGEAFGSLKAKIKGAWDSIVGAIKSAINAVIRPINGFIDGLNHIKMSVPSWVPFLGGKSFGISIPHIPLLAEGAILTRPTLNIAGEAGPEAMLPLSKLPGIMAESLALALQNMAGLAPAGGGTVTIELPVYLDGREIARHVKRYALDELTREQTRKTRAMGRPV